MITGCIGKFCNPPIYIVLDLFFNLFLQLVPLSVYDFNAIVGIRIVARCDHDAKIKVFLPDQIGDTRRRRYMDLIYIRTAGSKSCR